MFGLLAPLFVLSCWKWGDWKNWRAYYPTILYVISIDLLTNFLTADYPLWEFNYKIISHTLSDIFITFTVLPTTVILYLTHFPKKIGKQAIYTFSWVILYSLIEIWAVRLGLFAYDNGWNIWWSMGFNFVMFFMIKLHFERPLLAWPVSAALMTAVFYILKLPVKNLR